MIQGANTIITVLGMHRSGTSLCANLLHAMGVDMADAAGPSPANLRGHWERPRINDLNDQVFTLFGRAWSDASHILSLPEGWLNDGRVQAIRMALANVLVQALSRGRPCGFKDPRTARLLPLWRQVFETAGAAPRYVYCIRNPAQVSRSISARDRMANDQAEYRWLLYNGAAVAELGAAPICLVPYEHWFTEPDALARRIAVFAGVPEPAHGLASSIVDAGLRHDNTATARPLARRLHKAILNGIGMRDGQPVFNADVRALCTCLTEFEQQVQPLLVDREVLRASVADQNRVIGDLNAAIRELRRAAA